MPVDPMNWFALRGKQNPFEIPDPWNSESAAQQVASILGGEVVDNGPSWANSGNPAPIPPDIHWTVKVNGRFFKTEQLAQALTNYSPDMLRVQLNQWGITKLGPAPLPCLISYQTAYDLNPTATDPGPVPEWALQMQKTIFGV